MDMLTTFLFPPRLAHALSVALNEYTNIVREA